MLSILWYNRGSIFKAQTKKIWLYKQDALLRKEDVCKMVNSPIKKWLSSHTRMHALAASNSSSALSSTGGFVWSTIMWAGSFCRIFRNRRGTLCSTFPAHSKILSNNAIWRPIHAKRLKKKHRKWWAWTLIFHYLSSSTFLCRTFFFSDKHQW